jgi:repressor LexA
MPDLHPSQKKILDLLKSEKDEGLSIRNIQDRIGASSPSVVHHHILQLERKGFLRRNPNNPGDYQILADNPDKEITYLNVYGLAQCGPNGRILDGNPVDRIPISTKILGFPSSEAFMVKARGDSMTPLIKENDYIIARATNSPKDGDIVICVDGGVAMVKKFSHWQDQIILGSTNTAYAPFIAGEDFRVEGVVKAVYKYSS